MELLVSAAQMKQCDEYTIRGIGIPSMVLMERAALAVAEELERAGLDLSAVLVVCGSGNNGGDGFALARLLRERGAAVTVAFAGKESSLTAESRLQKQICEKTGIKPCSNFRDSEYTVIVDALFGVGLSRPVEGAYAELIGWMNSRDAVRVAVDIPSGVSADDGRILGVAVRADLTVTFAFRKIGQLLYPGAACCGRIVRREIGISDQGLVGGGAREECRPEAEHSVSPDAFVVFTCEEKDLNLIPPRNPHSHKGTYGRVLLIAGSRGMCGAAVLAARAACRSGCGLVRVFTPECNRLIVQTAVPEALLTTWETEEELFAKLDEALLWAQAVGIGPGFGCQETQERILTYVLRHYKKSLVIDADGLNLLTAHLPLLKETPAATVVTPHLGEMSRLTGIGAAQLSERLCMQAGQFARAYETVCVLKDARTVTSDGVRCHLNTSGNDGMATGGSGDVLTGLICGLLAQGMPAFEAAYFGVYIHGLAGDLAARERGRYGMTAGDIADRLGEILKRAER